VDLKQKTVGREIIESERSLVLAAPKRYGDYHRHASDAPVLLSHGGRGRMLTLRPSQRGWRDLERPLVWQAIECRRLRRAASPAVFALAPLQPRPPDRGGRLEPAVDLVERRLSPIRVDF
jgi:hypothetical protein